MASGEKEQKIGHGDTESTEKRENGPKPRFKMRIWGTRRIAKLCHKKTQAEACATYTECGDDSLLSDLKTSAHRWKAKQHAI